MQSSDPKPGDLIAAMHRMRAWEADWKRGVEGQWIKPGEIALVISVYQLRPKRVRLNVMFNDMFASFSCKEQHLTLNWVVVGTAATGS